MATAALLCTVAVNCLRALHETGSRLVSGACALVFGASHFASSIRSSRCCWTSASASSRDCSGAQQLSPTQLVLGVGCVDLIPVCHAQATATALTLKRNILRNTQQITSTPYTSCLRKALPTWHPIFKMPHTRTTSNAPATAGVWRHAYNR